MPAGHFDTTQHWTGVSNLGLITQPRSFVCVCVCFCWMLQLPLLLLLVVLLWLLTRFLVLMALFLRMPLDVALLALLCAVWLAGWREVTISDC